MKQDLYFEAIFRAEFATMVREMYLITGSAETARDAVADAFLELLRNWKRIRDYDKPGAWVRRVALRKAVKETRRSRRHVTEQQPSVYKHDFGETTEGLRLALLSLPPKQRAATVLRYYGDCSYEDIGSCLGCATSTARAHVSQARLRLEKFLTEQENDVDEVY